MFFLHRAIVACAVLFLLVGCSRSPYEMAEVTGKVTIENVPFTDGSVTFSPVAEGKVKKVGKPAYGVLMPDGTFRLSTYSKHDGAVVGRHRVSISSKVDEEISTDEQGKRIVIDNVTSFGFLELYDQTFDVKSGEDNQFEINLTKEYIKQYRQWDD